MISYALLVSLVAVLALYGFHYAAVGFFAWLDRQFTLFDQALSSTVLALIWIVFGFVLGWMFPYWF